MSTVPRSRNPGPDALLYRTGVPQTHMCSPSTSPVTNTQQVLHPHWQRCRQSAKELNHGPVFPIPPNVPASSVFFPCPISFLSFYSLFFLFAPKQQHVQSASQLPKQLSLCDLQNNPTRAVWHPYSVQGKCSPRKGQAGVPPGHAAEWKLTRGLRWTPKRS